MSILGEVAVLAGVIGNGSGASCTKDEKGADIMAFVEVSRSPSFQATQANVSQQVSHSNDCARSFFLNRSPIAMFLSLVLKKPIPLCHRCDNLQLSSHPLAAKFLKKCLRLILTARSQELRTGLLS